MFAEIKKSAVQSTANLRSFREDWLSEQTQYLFARARESLEADGDLSKSVTEAKYGWNEEKS